jgi:hypothetical protein
MDSTERLVHDYLSHQGFTDIVYEPDGKVPPDFLVDGHVAVEVRRLNQHEDYEGVVRGLEETAIPFGRTVRRVLKNFGAPQSGRSWFVTYSFERPIPERRVAMRLLRRALEEFSKRQPTASTTIELPHNLVLHFLPAEELHPQMFVLGGSDDPDSGGFVVSELIRNLSICVTTKSERIAAYRNRYPEWWLILVDHIAYGWLDAEDVSVLREQRAAWLAHSWERIVLVSPLDAQRATEV